MDPNQRRCLRRASRDQRKAGRASHCGGAEEGTRVLGGLAITAPALEAVHVRKTYPGVVALDDVSISVPAGSTLVLIGESGCGKSTFLRLFNHLVDPDSGTVRVRGQSVADVDAVTLRRSIGYVPQDDGLLPHWTVARNICLVPELLGWDRPRMDERADELLDLVGLDPALVRSRHPHELSGGQRQRVAVARALAVDPDIVLLDEPFGALDAITRLDLQDEFLRIRSRVSCTMLLVTHDIHEAFRLGDEVGVMRSGRLLAVATPSALSAGAVDDVYVRSLVTRGLTATKTDSW